MLALVCLLAGAARGGFEWKDGRWVQTTPAAKGTPQGQIEAIRALVDTGKGRSAVKAAEDFLKKNRTGEFREQALMLAGQAEFNEERYYQAYEWFEKQLSEFPNGPLADRALDREYRVGDAFLKGKKRIVGKVFRLPAEDEGVEILMRVAEHAPGSAIAEKAMMRIPDHFFNKPDYEQATQRYEDFLKIFPKSQQAVYASLQAAKASFAMYKGPGFDDRPLLNALEKFKRFDKLYPRASEKEKIPGKISSISEQLAERMYRTGEFYDRTGQAGSARFYYRKLVQAHPQTQWAQRAKSKLGPAAPRKAADSKTNWLGDVFAPKKKPAPTPPPRPAVGPKTTPKPAVGPKTAPKPAVGPKPAPLPTERPASAPGVAVPPTPKPMPANP